MNHLVKRNTGHHKDNAVPFSVSCCGSVPYAYKNKLQEQLRKLKAEGSLSEVTKLTVWVGSIIVAPKKITDDYRPCIYFRQLNRFCKQEFFTSLTVVKTGKLRSAH